MKVTKATHCDGQMLKFCNILICFFSINFVHIFEMHVTLNDWWSIHLTIFDIHLVFFVTTHCVQTTLKMQDKYNARHFKLFKKELSNKHIQD